MIVAQALGSLAQGVQSARRDHARLTHAAAHHLAVTVRGLDQAF